MWLCLLVISIGISDRVLWGGSSAVVLLFASDFSNRLAKSSEAMRRSSLPSAASDDDGSVDSLVSLRAGWGTTWLITSATGVELVIVVVLVLVMSWVGNDDTTLVGCDYDVIGFELLAETEVLLLLLRTRLPVLLLLPVFLCLRSCFGLDITSGGTFGVGGCIPPCEKEQNVVNKNQFLRYGNQGLPRAKWTRFFKFHLSFYLIGSS